MSAPTLDPTQPGPVLSDPYLRVGCPKCHAVPGKPCSGLFGGGVHPARANFYDDWAGRTAVASDSFGGAPEGVDSLGIQRWQYTVVNVGAFKSVDRMAAMLANAGSQGWELAATMDKQSNWFAGMEKGFLILKRPVPAGAKPEQWCFTVRS